MSALTTLFWLSAAGGAFFRVVAAYRIHLALQRRHFLAARSRSSAEEPGASSPVSVSVCVPARNEAAVIDRLLNSLDRQDHASLQVVVVDDRSTDDTGARARHHRCTVVDGSEPPDGWLGKQWALRNAASAATGEILCFVDADTWHDPAAIRTCAAHMEAKGLDVLVVVSGHALGTWWERWVLPFFWCALLSFLDVDRANDPERPDDAMGNGQFFLVRRSAYDRIGGHEAVRDRLAEDVAIVRALKHAGARYELCFGPNLTRTRMYTSLGELWRGFEKNAAVVDPSRPGLSITLTVLAVVLSAQAELWPWLVLGLAPTLGGIWAHPLALLLASSQLAAIAVGRLLLMRALCDAPSNTRLSARPFTYLGQPVGAIIAMAAMLNSLQAQLRGATRWKGRTVRGRSL